MKNVYRIEGMTCNGCKTSVEDTLNALQVIQRAEVNLEKGEAIIETKEPVSITELQQSLSPKYTISRKEDTVKVVKTTAKKSDTQQLFPLFLIFIYIIAGAVLLNYRWKDFSGFMLDFMGLFYIVFSFFKLLDLKGFPDSFSMYDPIAKRIPIYGWIYPFIELALGLLFLTRTQLNIALILTIIILGITTIGVTKVLLDKRQIQCACLGTALKLPMTKATFIENSVMLVMAIAMLVF